MANENIILITTALKTRDSVALTAFQCLTHELGLADRLIRLKREDAWKIYLDPSVEDPVATGRMLAEETKLFVNPNKQTYNVSLWNNPPKEHFHSGNGVFRIPLAVTPLVDTISETTLNLLHQIYYLEAVVRDVLHGVIWTLHLKADNIDDARKLAATIAVTKTRNEGLLANPHAQRVTFLNI